MMSENLVTGWTGILAGCIWGAAIGLQFHKEGWLGGYASFQRRLLRLGHISLIGLGMLNILFALSVQQSTPVMPALQAASAALMAGLVAMPLCCLLCAWRSSLRQLLVLPASAVLAGIALLLAGWTIR